ncbi:hypothetical protein SAMN06265784_1051 [Paraburkholderia susongensis]|uniref:Transposase n=1 Tax=Paraburkholderia susongensis TaxID=1515439 RepID=A0A1X7L4F1_9BURK|nr:hypothetical protein SAMN06265784_1051 [Paraburkholderia susongensis]
MTKTKSLYHGHRFPATIISHAMRWYFRFQLSLRDIEELFFEKCDCGGFHQGRQVQGCPIFSTVHATWTG